MGGATSTSKSAERLTARVPSPLIVHLSFFFSCSSLNRALRLYKYRSLYLFAHFFIDVLVFSVDHTADVLHMCRRFQHQTQPQTPSFYWTVGLGLGSGLGSGLAVMFWLPPAFTIKDVGRMMLSVFIYFFCLPPSLTALSPIGL